MGGSTNSILHLTAIAHEAGIGFSLSAVNEISERTPYICKLSPAGSYHIEDLDKAGGVPAIMNRCKTGWWRTPRLCLAGRLVKLRPRRRSLTQTSSGLPKCLF